MIRSRPSFRRIQPRLETLEDRKLLYATLGANWAFGSRITFSVVPDGTDIGGLPSALFQSLNSRGISSSQAIGAFQKAAAAWESVTNINLSLVPDSGASFGAVGNQQGDPDFGDIRIGGAALASNVLATCFLPPPINGGTLAGDIVFNTSQAWKINSDFDLQTVAIHEIGHSLGLDHSAITSAVMYASYNGMKQSLTADDITGLQSVYGTRSNDAFDTAAPNNSYTTSTNLNGYLNTNAQVRLGALDITTSSDNDWYVITAPAGTTGSLTVSMQSANLSLLSPKVTIYSAGLQVLASDTKALSFGATATPATIAGVVPGQKFYIRAQAASGGTSGVGGYGLIVNFGSGAMTPIDPPVTIVSSKPDQGGGSSNQQFGEVRIVSVGMLQGLGDDLMMGNLPRGYGSVTVGVPSLPSSPIATWLAFLPPDSLAKLQRLEKLSDRATLLKAIDDVLVTWMS